MKAAWLTVNKRLILLGLFTNALLVIAVCVGAFSSWRVSLSFEAATKQQEQVALAGEMARTAEIAFRTESAEFANVLLRDAESRDSHIKAFESAAAEVDKALANLGPMLDVIGFERSAAIDLRREHAALPASPVKPFNAAV